MQKIIAPKRGITRTVAPKGGVRRVTGAKKSAPPFGHSFGATPFSAMNPMTAIDSLNAVMRDYDQLDNPLHLLPNNERFTKITEYIAASDYQGLQNLIDMCGMDFIDSVNLKNKDGDTPLSLAVKKQRIAIAEILLKAGAATNVRNKAGWTPLHIAGNSGPL